METSDFITHTDVIRNFVQSPERSKLVDYCTPAEARNVAMEFRVWLSNEGIKHVNVIQRGIDILLYKPTPRKRKGAYKCSS